MESIRTALSLPFAVSYPDRPFFSSGGETTVSIECGKTVDATNFAPILDALKLFSKLARAGGLSGAHLRPDLSALEGVIQIVANANTVVFECQESRVDDRALVVLCDLLL